MVTCDREAQLLVAVAELDTSTAARVLGIGRSAFKMRAATTLHGGVPLAARSGGPAGAEGGVLDLGTLSPRRAPSRRVFPPTLDALQLCREPGRSARCRLTKPQHIESKIPERVQIIELKRRKPP